MGAIFKMRLTYIHEGFVSSDKTIVVEGFRFEPAIDRAQYEERINKEYTTKTKKVNGVESEPFKALKKGSRTRLAKYLRESGNIVFSDTDSPEDFIFIEPVMKSQAIPVKPRDPKELSTFMGSKISYGFTIRDPAGFSDKLSTSESTIPEILRKANDIVRMGWPHEESMEKVIELGWPTSEFKELSRNDMNINTLKKLKAEWDMAMPRMKRDSGFDFSEYQEYMEELDTLVKFMSSTGIDNLRVLKSDSLDIYDLESLKREWTIMFPELNKKSGKYLDHVKLNIDNIKSLLNLITEKGVETIKQLIRSYSEETAGISEFGKNHLKRLQTSFIKMVKEPEPKEVAVQQKFVEYSARVFTEKNTNEYDVIMYPKSGSTFNKNFAEILSSHLSDALVYEIPKRKIKDVIFNYEEMMRRARTVNRKKNEELGRVPSEKEWVDIEVRKMKGSFHKDPEREAVMKHQLAGDKRRYAQLFQMDEPELFEGASILVIDDNVVHQGTFEMIHALISICSPTRIDMYTPFYYRSL